MKLGILGISVLTLVAACSGARPPETNEADSSRLNALEETQWESLYAGASLQDIRVEISTLMDILTSETDPHYEREFANQEYAVQGTYTPGTPFALDTQDAELSEFRFLPDGKVGKVVLKEAEYPQQYEMYRQIKWLLALQANMGGG